MDALGIHTETKHCCLPQVPCNCGSILFTTQSVIDHFEDHIKKKKIKFQCPYCSRSYKTEPNFRSHLRLTHENDKKFTCDTCGNSFKEARHLAVHMNTHLPADQRYVHACVVCNKKYSSIFSLRSHVKVVHVNVSKFLFLKRLLNKLIFICSSKSSNVIFVKKRSREKLIWIRI
jgi:uncharacterized Zn-finger protein